MHDRQTRSARLCGKVRAVVADRERGVAVAARELDPHLVAAVLQRVLEELAEDERKRGGTVAGQRDRLELCLDALACAQALDEHRPQPLQELPKVDLLLA